MNIAMPSVEHNVPKKFDTCVLYLAKSKDNPSNIMTVIKGHSGHILYFESDGSITHSSGEYFNETYELIREYKPGETLSITK